MEANRSKENRSYSASELLERMKKIDEEREQEYRKLNQQYQQREEDLRRIGQDLARQKEQQEQKEAHLHEYEETLQQIQNQLEERTSKLKDEESALDQLAAEQKEQIEKENKALKEKIAAVEIEKQVEVNELRNQRLALDRERGELQLMRQKYTFGTAADPEELEQQLQDSRQQIQELQEQLSVLHRTDSEDLQQKLQDTQLLLQEKEDMIRQLQQEKGKQLQKIFDLDRELKRVKEEGEAQQLHPRKRLTPEQMEEYLKGLPEFSNVYCLHSEDGDIVTSLKGSVHYRFAFKDLPFFDLCIQRKENAQIKETIYQLNMDKSYKFSYDQERAEAVLTGYFLPDISCEELMDQVREAAKCIAAE